MNFQITVVIVALFILVIMLTIIGYILYNNRKNKKFPPVLGDCPDYWVAKNKQCTNPQNLGTCSGPQNFNTDHFQGHDGDCQKSKWARSCNATWQGITDNPNVCK